MMMKHLFLMLAMVVSGSGFLAAQDVLYESQEYKNAYEKATRARTGEPGPNYWQNRSDYEIKAVFHPEESTVSGHLRVKYFNNSPDTLREVVFKLMQNLYKKGAARQTPVEGINLHSGIETEHVTIGPEAVDGQAIRIAGTVMHLQLKQGLGPGQNAVIEMDFITPIPKTAGLRSGHVDSTSVFAAYWFPQIAVYDDIFGWDTDEYIGIPENYNDFSDYDVELALPSEYNVWATGRHLNPRDIFSKKIMERIENSKKAGTPVDIITEEDFRRPDGRVNTWKFRAEGVPDFAWGASGHYLWQGVAAHNPDADHTCWVQSAWAPGAPAFGMVAEIAKKSIEAFSTQFPGVPYPYFKHISFSGTQGGGMEFPMLANNHATPDTTSTGLVTAHELAHNYYPFMMGVNERKYGWWDETMTTLMESYLSENIFPDREVHGFFRRSISFNLLSGMHDIMPLMSETSNIMKVMPSIVNFYIKGPAAMDVLMDLIGQQEFYKLNREFMQTWKGRHPTPYDFFYFINNRAGKNLNWFWSAWFFSFGYPDPAVTHARQNGEYLAVTIANKGGLPVPFEVIVHFDDDSMMKQAFNVSEWKGNPQEITIRIPVNRKVKSVSLDRRYSYDANVDNNEFILTD